MLDGNNSIKDAKFIEGPEGWMGKRFDSDITDLRKKVEALPDLDPTVTDFHESVRTRKKFALNEDNGFRSATLVNLGKIAHRLNKNLKFDSKTLKFDDPEANKLVNQPMRGPWTF